MSRGKPQQAPPRATVEAAEDERHVVGALLFDPRCVAEVLDVAKPEDFAARSLQLIYLAVLRLSDEGGAVDLSTVAGALAGTGTLDTLAAEWTDATGFGLLVDISEGVTSAANVKHHAANVATAARIRRIASAAQTIVDLAARSGLRDADDCADRALDLLVRATETRSGRVTSGTMKDEANGLVDLMRGRFQRQLRGEDDTLGRTTSWGLPDLDKATRGLPLGGLTVVAGRPGHGKTILGEMVATTAAEAGGGAVFLSCEMSRASIVARTVSARGLIPMGEMVGDQIQDSSIVRLVNAVAKLREFGGRFLLDDLAGATIGHLERVIGRYQRLNPAHPLRVVVVDYLQLMRTGNPRQSMYEAVSEISRGLLDVAKTHDVAVCALAQLSRKCEERADKRPQLSDLRDSGQIEQDASLVVGIYRDEVYNENSDAKGIAELCVLKNRAGTLSRVKAGFQGEFQRFVALADATKYQEPRARAAGGRWRDDD